MKEQKVIIYALVISVCLTVDSHAQEWVRRYNGTGNAADLAHAITVDNAGNVYVTGSSHNGSSYDYATLKYDAQGSEQWVARYTGTGNSDARAIAIDNIGNSYVTGESAGSGTNLDYATVKYDSAGVEQWVARYNAPFNLNDRAYAIAVNNAGNSYVTGNSCGDYATLKYDAQGSEQWVARYTGTGNGLNRAYAIAIDNTGSVYVTGYSLGSGGGQNLDYATIKYDSLGSEQWVSRYDGTSNYRDEAYAIAVDNAGNVYVTGFSYGSGTNRDYATVKYDSAGVEQWVARYNGTGNYRDEAYAIAVDNAGNVHVTGVSYGAYSSFDYATIKYDSLGTEQWVATHDHSGNGSDFAYAIAVDSAGYVHVTGRSYGAGTDDYETITYDSMGAYHWMRWYNAPSNGPDRANAIAIDNAGYVYVTGESWGWGTDYDYATIKYFPIGIEEQKVITVNDNHVGQTIFSGSLLLPKGKKCRVFDIMGRVVLPDKIKPGIYFIEVDGKITQKVIKVK